MIKLKTNKITDSGKLKKKIVWCVVLLLIISVLFLSNPDKISFTKCLFHQTTGYSCPSCGLSRSLYAASHLDLKTSFQYHLMGPIILFALFLILIKLSYEIIVRKEILIQFNPKIIRIFFASFIGLWVFFVLVRFIIELQNH